MRIIRILTVACILAACSNDATSPSPPEPEPERPVNVTVSSGSVQPQLTRARVTLHLRNSGGRGVYQVEFYTLRTSPFGAHRKWAVSEGVEVLKDYDETVTWVIEGTNDIDWVVVYNRDYGSATYRMAACYDFGGQDCASL